MSHSLTRRGAIAMIAAASVPTGALAFDYEETDPADLVPRRYSLPRFLELTEAEIYKANLAVKRGRPIRIDGFSVAQSRQIILDARQDWPGTRAKLTQKR